MDECYFTKSNTPPWVFLTFFKILQMVSNCAKHINMGFRLSKCALLRIEEEESWFREKK